MHTTSLDTARAGTTIGAHASATGAALLAALLGLFLLWGVGFSHLDAFHNAAHDTRHSNAFPCH
ncbi:MAG TPA: CbtB domain-containing protein [Candidatus Acidoferrum sp.]|nr:CbtB domain-containing protein [Candidatus Acidoferrum sp.]